MMYELFSAVFPRITFETALAVIITFQNTRKTYNSIISPAIVPGGYFSPQSLTV